MVQEGADHQIPMRPTFHRFYEQDVVKAFDNDALSTRWMLKQMKTYDTGKQIVIGIISIDGQVSASTVVERRKQLRDE